MFIEARLSLLGGLDMQRQLFSEKMKIIRFIMQWHIIETATSERAREREAHFRYMS
jgi:hypothetical protein